MALTIEELSVQTKVHPSTIRYYERRGVLPLPQQSKVGSREYDDVDIERVKFVRFSRVLGLELDEIRALIEMIGEGNSEEIDVAEQSVIERSYYLTRFCENLAKVSAEIRTGEIDEANAFRILSESGVTVGRDRSSIIRNEELATGKGSKNLLPESPTVKGRAAKSC